MKVLCLTLALCSGGAAFAGGAIGGSTGSKCSEYIGLRPLEFQLFAEEALRMGELNVHGEIMDVEALDLDEQTMQLRSRLHRERSLVWYVAGEDEE